MKDKENVFIDLSKLSEEQIKALPKIFENSGDKVLPETLSDLISGKITDGFKFLFYSPSGWNQNDYPLNERIELTYPVFIKLFEGPTKLPSELLKEYFKNTPREQVLKDWESTSGYDNVNSPKVLELFEGEEKYELGGGLLHNPKSDNNGWIKIESELDLPKEKYGLYHVLTKDDIYIEKPKNQGLEEFYNSPDKVDWWIQNVLCYHPIIKPEPPNQ